MGEEAWVPTGDSLMSFGGISLPRGQETQAFRVGRVPVGEGGGSTFQEEEVA